MQHLFSGHALAKSPVTFREMRNWLKPQQIRMLLGDLLTRLQIEGEAEVIDAICQMNCLAPGDFANLHRQSLLRPYQSIREVCDALQAEVRLKPQAKQSGRIGF